MLEGLALLKAHLFDGAELGAKSWPGIATSLERAEDNALVVALLALADMPALTKKWLAWRRVSGLSELSGVERLLYLSIERDDVEQAIDEALATALAAPVADGLVRAGFPWSHPGLVGLLDSDEGRAPAAWLLADVGAEELAGWLEACEDDEAALAVARSIGLNGNALYWDEIVAWLELARDEGDEDARKGFHAALANLDPTAYARAVMLGEMEVDWLGQSVCVADFLGAHGPTEWLETLELLAHHASQAAFEFAALLAVSAAAGADNELWDSEDVEAMLQCLEIAREAPGEAVAQFSASGQFGFQMALGEEDDLAVLLAEAAIHERLLALGEASPGVGGLPLSATDLEWAPLDVAEEFFERMLAAGELSDEALVALVRTLVDLRQWSEREPEHFGALAARTAKQFKAHPSAAVAAAGARIEQEASFEHEIIAQTARREDVIGLDAVRQLVERGGDEALAALVELWVGGPLERAPFYRESLIQVRA
ncbi:MAG: hypothetical protein H0U74_09670 [Bradymonadaceae bacterium]|nr:hypothetical protein [Lujinxingiaceae bacterium]